MRKTKGSKREQRKARRYKIEAGMILTPDKEEVVLNIVEVK